MYESRPPNSYSRLVTVTLSPLFMRPSGLSAPPPLHAHANQGRDPEPGGALSVTGVVFRIISVRWKKSKRPTIRIFNVLRDEGSWIPFFVNPFRIDCWTNGRGRFGGATNLQQTVGDYSSCWNRSSQQVFRCRVRCFAGMQNGYLKKDWLVVGYGSYSNRNLVITSGLKAILLLDSST